MNHKPQLQALPCADLTAAGEERLLEAARRCGGGVVQPDRTALERQMVEVVGLLAAIDAALLPPIIQDRLVS